MPKYHTSLTPVTLFLLRTRLYFQMLYQHTFISHKCLKLNICKTEFNLLFSNKLFLVSSLSQETQLSFLYSSKMETLIIPWILPSHWLKFNYSTQHFTFFFRDISQVWLLLLSALPWSFFKSVLIILSNYFSNFCYILSNPFNMMIVFLKNDFVTLC